MAIKEIKQLKNGLIADKDTGEVLENGTFIYIPHKVKIKERWFMGFQEAFISLAKDKEIKGNDRRVLDYLFGQLNFENYIALMQKEIGESLGIKRPHVSASIKILVRKKIILKGPKLGCSHSYRLNHFYAWKGSVKSLDSHKKHLRLVKS